MDDLDRTLKDMQRRLERAAERARRRNEPVDDQPLVRAVENGTAGPADVARLAGILAPAVRSQLVECAMWRSDFHIHGEKLPFSPCMPMQVVVEMCSVPADDDLPGDLECSFSQMLKYSPDSWERIKHPWMSRTMYLDWVEATVLIAAAESTDCMAIRKYIDRVYAHDAEREALFVPADERALRLAAPLRSATDIYRYKLVSEIGWPFP